jgi:hypothetical protein
LESLVASIGELRKLFSLKIKAAGYTPVIKFATMLKRKKRKKYNLISEMTKLWQICSFASTNICSGFAEKEFFSLL